MSSQRKWALVTGASSGLGKEFARSLAARKYNVVLVARREAALRELAAELEQAHDISAIIEPLDLAEPASTATLAARLEGLGIEPDVLVNNAAFGISGRFVSQDPARLREMLQLDIGSLVELTQVFAQCMEARGSGHILLVASLAAYQPTPLLAAYGAAKHFVRAFGEALHVELAPAVGVTVVSPGLMETEFLKVAGYRPKPFLRRTMIAASEVAETGLKAMFAGKPSIVVGRLNRLSAFSNRFTSGSMQAKVAYRMAQD